MPIITSLDQLDLNKTYTYADYLTWQFKERVELFRGKLVKMSPAPNLKHQRLVGNTFFAFKQFLQKHTCEVFVAPFDVVLAKKGKDTVVQPDICVVCEPAKLNEQGCLGAPDLIVEVLSRGNSRKERKEKFDLYEENGVKEYWMIDPFEEYIVIYKLSQAGKYIGSKPYLSGDTLSSTALSGFQLSVGQIFET